MVLDILEYPHPRLRRVASPVAIVTADLRKLVRDMAETMYAAPGVGLAATQVDVHKRIIVIDVSPAHDDLRVFINPELIAAEGEAECEEGCLSVPGCYDKVRRAARITVRAQDERGAGHFSVGACGVDVARVRRHSVPERGGKHPAAFRDRAPLRSPRGGREENRAPARSAALRRPDP